MPCKMSGAGQGQGQGAAMTSLCACGSSGSMRQVSRWQEGSSTAVAPDTSLPSMLPFATASNAGTTAGLLDACSGSTKTMG